MNKSCSTHNVGKARGSGGSGKTEGRKNINKYMHKMISVRDKCYEKRNWLATLGWVVRGELSIEVAVEGNPKRPKETTHK